MGRIGGSIEADPAAPVRRRYAALMFTLTAPARSWLPLCGTRRRRRRGHRILRPRHGLWAVSIPPPHTAVLSACAALLTAEGIAVVVADTHRTDRRAEGPSRNCIDRTEAPSNGERHRKPRAVCYRCMALETQPQAKSITINVAKPKPEPPSMPPPGRRNARRRNRTLRARLDRPTIRKSPTNFPHGAKGV